MHQEVKNAEELKSALATGKVLVDFWATWCGPCQMMGQLMERELEPAMPDLKIVKIDVDAAPQLAAEFGVMSIPALFCFKDGVKTAEFVGVTSIAEIRAAFN